VSSVSSRAVRQARHSENSWTRRVECVESSRVETWRAKWNLGYRQQEYFKCFSVAHNDGHALRLQVDSSLDRFSCSANWKRLPGSGVWLVGGSVVAGQPLPSWPASFVLPPERAEHKDLSYPTHQNKTILFFHQLCTNKLCLSIVTCFHILRVCVFCFMCLLFRIVSTVFGCDFLCVLT